MSGKSEKRVGRINALVNLLRNIKSQLKNKGLWSKIDAGTQEWIDREIESWRIYQEKVAKRRK